MAAPPPPKGFQVLTAPIKVPDVLPDIDLSKKVTDEADFSGKGVAGGVAKGVVGGTAPVNTDQPYFEFQVEKQVAADPGHRQPRYPDMLRSANVEGEVLAQFVVDTTGRARDRHASRCSSPATSCSRRPSRTRCRTCASTRPKSADAR